ncbi:MAG TPA: VWA domain-containing protein [Terriglobia bacterium]|nr:VWA domain-containing protein [Terriglobia bacterium]
MNFLNPFFLIGAGVLAVPILIHLVRRERSEIIPFSSLMFLLKIPKRMIRQQMLKNLLLMALRLLLIALLVSVFARPYLVQSATPDGPKSGQGRGVVMLLDNSYSMRYGQNFDKMKSEALSRINALGSGDRMAIVSFNDSAQVVVQPTPDKGKLRAAVDGLEPSFAGTRYFEAFSVADRLLSQFGGQEQNLILISDFQRTGWNRSSRESVIGHDVKAEMVSVGVADSSNIGIDNVSVDATSFVRTYSGRVVARIHNYRRDKEVSVPVALLINDKEEARKNVLVPASGTALAEFSGFDLPLGFVKGKIRIAADDPLPQDNEFLFSIERREKLNVMILDAGRSRQSFLLRTAYTAAPDLPFNVRVGNASAVTVEELGSQEIVIFNDVPRLSDAVRDRAVQARKAGQGQFVILGNTADLRWWETVDGFPAKPLRRVDVSKERGKSIAYLTSYDRNHGIFKRFQGSSRLGLNTAQFFQYIELEPKPGAFALAKFDNGHPALVESPANDRGMLVFASALDNTWNDLPLKPSFVPFMFESARYLAGYNAAKGWYTLGEGIPIIGALEGGTARVVDPSGNQDSVGEGELKSGEQRYYSPSAPGFYELRVGRDRRLLAVNPPSNEGNLEMMIPEDLLAGVQSTEAEARQTGTFVTDDKLEYARQQMGWWYLLLIALIAGIVELYIANTRTQSVRRVG